MLKARTRDRRAVCAVMQAETPFVGKLDAIHPAPVNR